MLHNKKRKKLTFNFNSFVIIFIFIIFSAVLTCIIPAGEYDRITTADGGEIVDVNSFHTIDQTPVNPLNIFTCITEAFTENAEIIFFILFAYCFVGALMKAGVFDTMMHSAIRLMQGHVEFVLPIIMIIFGVLGSIAGIAEETFGLFPVCIALAVSLGYDEIVGGASIYLAVFTGFASATLNPFTIGIAQTIAGVPIYSGLGFRIVCWFVFMTILICYVMRYANRVRRDPTQSLLHDTHNRTDASYTIPEHVRMTIRQKLCAVVFVAVLIMVVVGVMAFGWYIKELSALFFAATIIVGILAGWSPSTIADNFVDSGSNTVFSMLIIGFSNAISVILAKGHITDSIVHGLASLLNGTSGYISALLMLLIQNLLNFFIPSGPGQAVVSMPIMAALADVTGMSRQLAVLAFQFGDGYSNMLWPTMVCMMCGIMKIPVNKWYRFLLPLFMIMFIAQIIMICIAVYIGY